MSEQTFDIQEMVDLSGVPRRNIYFYVQQDLLPPPSGAGLAARYSREHLIRLRLIPHLRQMGLRLDDIRARLRGMGLEEMEHLLSEREKLAGELHLKSEPAPSSVSGAQASLRYDLAGGVIVLVPAGAPADVSRMVERMLAAALQPVPGLVKE